MGDFDLLVKIIIFPFICFWKIRFEAELMRTMNPYTDII